MKIHHFWHVLWTAWKPLVILKKGISKEGISYSGGTIIRHRHCKICGIEQRANFDASVEFV